jgi:hypothetical protein
MRASSLAFVVAAGVTGAAILRNAQIRSAMRREAELLGLRAYLAAVDRGSQHRAFVSEVRNIRCPDDGAWLCRAYGAGERPTALSSRISEN